MKIPDRVRFINKKFTNRLMIRIAGKQHSPIVLLEHKGRSSGNPYTIPLLAQEFKDGFMFALTYGTNVDWYKNVLAAGWARLTCRGVCYELSDPVVVETTAGQASFSFPKGQILRIIGIRDFFFMKGKLIPPDNDQISLNS
jgi:deazaflavin-dependent oxidoreductase (nitroreductase family)